MGPSTHKGDLDKTLGFDLCHCTALCFLFFSNKCINLKSTCVGGGIRKLVVGYKICPFAHLLWLQVGLTACVTHTEPKLGPEFWRGKAQAKAFRCASGGCRNLARGCGVREVATITGQCTEPNWPLTQHPVNSSIHSFLGAEPSAPTHLLGLTAEMGAGHEPQQGSFSVPWVGTLQPRPSQALPAEPPYTCPIHT